MLFCRTYIALNWFFYLNLIHFFLYTICSLGFSNFFTSEKRLQCFKMSEGKIECIFLIHLHSQNPCHLMLISHISGIFLRWFHESNVVLLIYTSCQEINQLIVQSFLFLFAYDFHLQSWWISFFCVEIWVRIECFLKSLYNNGHKLKSNSDRIIYHSVTIFSFLDLSRKPLSCFFFFCIA